MLDEGIITNDNTFLLKSEMLKQLWLHKRTTPEAWEKNVIKAITGFSPEEMDWDFEDNHAGYHTWLRSFEHLITELVADGFVREEFHEGKKVLIMTEPELS